MKKKILVVDDEPDFLKLIEVRLEANNYEVATASNGKAGLEAISSYKPDAVLLDILMPEMDGLEVLKEIRKNNKNLPVFMITVFSTDDEFDQKRFKLAKSMGATGFIFKTRDLDSEIKNVTTLLEVIDKNNTTIGA